MGSRPSAPSTQVIQKPQMPIVTGVEFSDRFLLGQAEAANLAQAGANAALKTYFDNANIGRAAAEQYKPMSFGEFDYTTLLPTDKEIAREERLRRKDEYQENKREQRKDRNEEERATYFNALAFNRMPPRSQGGAARMIRGG